MNLLRPLLVSVTAFALIALPGAVAASADSGAVSQGRLSGKADLFPTRIAFLATDHVRAYGSSTVVRGQVLTDHGEGEGSLPATVDLLRRYQGNPTWVTIRRAATTGDTTAPRFTFDVPTVATADYMVTFAGDAANAASSATTRVWAFRKITTHVKPRLLQVYGKVAPNFKGKRLIVERKTCAQCNYKRIRTTLVGAGSAYEVTLKAPARGRWFWRLTVPGDAKYIASHSAVVSTRRR